MFGRSSVSGTYGLFKSRVLCDGDFKPSVSELPSSASIVQSVAFFKGAIGYAAWGFQYSGVKLLSVAESDASQLGELQPDDFVAPSEDNIRNRRYPFTRTLYLMVNKAPGEPLENPVLEFIKFIFSEQGAGLTRREGYVPVNEQQKMQLINALSRD
jgi:phosphate transport system substrate-binding protein